MSRGLRAERPVHEHLQIADAQPVVAEPGAEPDLLQPGDVVVRQGLPDAEREPALAGQALPEPQRPEPAVLVVHGGHSAGRGDPEPLPHRVHELVV